MVTREVNAVCWNLYIYICRIFNNDSRFTPREIVMTDKDLTNRGAHDDR